MVDVVRLIIEYRQIYTHHHATLLEEVVKVAYYQVHGFNDDGHLVTF